MLNKSMYTSENDEWETPKEFFQKYDDIYHFELDVCALPHNTKCRKYYTPQDDGLKQPWKGVCWMNPPYGRAIGAWMKKAVAEAQKGATVVCLLPARTDTSWWHEYCMPYGKIEFIRGRIKFVGSKYGAPFPSAVVVFGEKMDGARRE